MITNQNPKDCSGAMRRYNLLGFMSYTASRMKPVVLVDGRRAKPRFDFFFLSMSKTSFSTWTRYNKTGDSYNSYPIP